MKKLTVINLLLSYKAYLSLFVPPYTLKFE